MQASSGLRPLDWPLRARPLLQALGVMSTNIWAIGLLAIVTTVIGAILFFPMRWLAMRNAPNNGAVRDITSKDLFLMVPLVLFLLTLVWFMEAGNKLAAGVFALITASATIAGVVMLKKQKDKAERDDA